MRNLWLSTFNNPRKRNNMRWPLVIALFGALFSGALAQMAPGLDVPITPPPGYPAVYNTPVTQPTSITAQRIQEMTRMTGVPMSTIATFSNIATYIEDLVRGVFFGPTTGEAGILVRSLQEVTQSLDEKSSALISCKFPELIFKNIETLLKNAMLVPKEIVSLAKKDTFNVAGVVDPLVTSLARINSTINALNLLKVVCDKEQSGKLNPELLREFEVIATNYSNLFNSVAAQINFAEFGRILNS